MKILLDTHIFLWFISGDTRLSESLKEIIREPDNEVYLSVVSVWEAIIKHQLGKLPLPESPEIYLPKQRQRHLICSLPVDEESVAQLSQLPPIHRDPFDRMLISQAIQHKLTILTVDDAIRAYPVAAI
ncbi:type II toxin-antitoxin system VapC family toxin [bacterium]|nr:type II toxin-antitoxin system VapC family toxin [bacterium]